MNVQDQIKNLEVLLAGVEAQPTKLFDLSHYRQVEQCGTLFCTVGLATTLPHFQQQGFHMSTEARPDIGSRAFTGVKVGSNWIFDEGVAERYFGCDFDSLFAPADCGTLDEVLGYTEVEVEEDHYEGSMTDKELAVARLNYVIATLKEPA